MLSSAFARQYFREGSRPSSSTLRRWIMDGVLPGQRVGSHFYVDEAAYLAQNDPLVLKVLRAQEEENVPTPP
ncbi:MAG TPA: hypothetical protein PLV25_06855 [Opitutales bacterium]|nr:hypothetical protein [Opitutales bacterium]